MFALRPFVLRSFNPRPNVPTTSFISSYPRKHFFIAMSAESPTKKLKTDAPVIGTHK
jgi:hypothetical protein